MIAREADRSDAARAREAVRRSFTALAARVEDAAAINARSTLAVDLLRRENADLAPLRSMTHYHMPGVFGSEGVLLIDAAGRLRIASRAGHNWTGPHRADAERLARLVADRLPATGEASTHALMRDRQGRAVVVAAANILPEEEDPRPGLVGQPSPKIIFLHSAQGLLPKMLLTLGANDLRIVSRGDSPNSVVFPLDGGDQMVLSWRPRTPGRAAVQRWAPIFLVITIIAAALLALALSRSLAVTRALERLANFDRLTGLPNRAAFVAILEDRLRRGLPTAAGLVDLDGFKAINDTHGHLTGDDLLRAVAAELAGSAGPGDVTARLGGDEFAFVSPDLSAADRLTAEFYERLSRPLQAGTLRLHAAASVGVAEARPGMAPRDLLALADARLYRDKADGRACARVSARAVV